MTTTKTNVRTDQDKTKPHPRAKHLDRLDSLIEKHESIACDLQDIQLQIVQCVEKLVAPLEIVSLTTYEQRVFADMVSRLFDENHDRQAIYVDDELDRLSAERKRLEKQHEKEQFQYKGK